MEKFFVLPGYLKVFFNTPCMKKLIKIITFSASILKWLVQPLVHIFESRSGLTIFRRFLHNSQQLSEPH